MLLVVPSGSVDERRYCAGAVRRRVVYWKWEDEEDDGEGVGPVYVYTFGDSATEPEHEEQWDRWVRRSEALTYAQEHDYEFQSDE